MIFIKIQKIFEQNSLLFCISKLISTYFYAQVMKERNIKIWYRLILLNQTELTKFSFILEFMEVLKLHKLLYNFKITQFVLLLISLTMLNILKILDFFLSITTKKKSNSVVIQLSLIKHKWFYIDQIHIFNVRCLVYWQQSYQIIVQCSRI